LKNLTLIRHAKSSHADAGMRDFDRPLNDRGWADAPRMGQYLLQERAFSPDLLISSTAKRALTTAGLIAREIGYAPAKIQEEMRIYEAPVRNLIAVIQAVPDKYQHVCMVGHNPGMEYFSNWLVGARAIEDFVTCGVVLLDVNLTAWSQLAEKCATLKEFLWPRKLWDRDADD
jgi:phosphohistidine phosphatase